MEFRKKTQVSYDLEGVDAQELELLIQWGMTAANTEGRKWTDQEDDLLMELKLIGGHSKDRLNRRVERPSLRKMGETEDEREDWQKHGAIDTGQGMVWTERDDG